MPYYSLLSIASYLLGSISSAIIICRLFYGADIRELGSGNPGANNVQRVFGWKAGISVFAFDFLKGAAAVSLVFLTPLSPGTELFSLWQITFGLSAVMGHIFPIFHHFRGGKGVSVAAGAIFAVQPAAMLVCLSIFLIVFFITKYISLSVLIASFSYPLVINLLFALWLNPTETFTVKVFSVVVAVILSLTHISNIRRLKEGTEEKFAFKKAVKRVK